MWYKHILIIVLLIKKNKKKIFGIIWPFRGNNMSLFFPPKYQDSDIIYVGHCSPAEPKNKSPLCFFDRFHLLEIERNNAIGKK